MSFPILRKGSKGAAVRFAQKRLKAHGALIKVDGDFGPRTYDAVRQFQASRNIKVDGVIGPVTWSYLENESASYRESIGDGKAVEAAKKALLEKIPSDISTVRRKTLECAIRDLGADEVPDGSNWGIQIAHLVGGYNEYWGLDTSRYGHLPWCAMACSTWIGLGMGLGTNSSDMDWSRTPMKKFFGGAQQYESWGYEKGCYVEEYGVAEAASVFTMARGGSGSDPAQVARAGHVGLVICDNGYGLITTIEGNVSNGVRSYVRKKSDLHGFVEWWAA